MQIEGLLSRILETQLRIEEILLEMKSQEKDYWETWRKKKEKELESFGDNP